MRYYTFSEKQEGDRQRIRMENLHTLQQQRCYLRS